MGRRLFCLLVTILLMGSLAYAENIMKAIIDEDGTVVMGFYIDDKLVATAIIGEEREFILKEGKIPDGAYNLYRPITGDLWVTYFFKDGKLDIEKCIMYDSEGNPLTLDEMIPKKF